MSLTSKESNALSILINIANALGEVPAQHLNNACTNYTNGDITQKCNYLDEMIFIYITSCPSDSNFYNQLVVLTTEINSILNLNRPLPPKLTN